MPDYKQQLEDLTLAVGTLLVSGEFAYWLDGQTMPFAAVKELHEAEIQLDKAMEMLGKLKYGGK